MLKTVEDISTTKKRLKIEIPSDAIEHEIKDSLEKVRQRAKIPGFRQGKAPVSLIEKRFGKEIEAEVLEKVIPETYNAALREASLSPVGMPELEEKFEFKRNTPLSLSFIIEVLPDIGNLDYENITIKDIPFSVEDKDIDDMIERLRHQKAVFETVDREAEMDDLVTFEFSDCEIVGEETPPSVKETISKMGNEIFPKDTMHRVLGKKKGDFIEFTTVFNEIMSRELDGKTVNIKVKISEVKKKNLPPLDDEFAKDIGFDSLEALREKLQEKIHDAKKSQIQKFQKAEIINRIMETTEFEIPETLLKREMEAIIAEKSLSESKDDTVYADTMTEILDKAEAEENPEEKKDAKEDPEAKLTRKATKNVQASLIIDAIGKKEGILVSEQEVDDRIATIAKRLSAAPEVVRNFYMYKEGSLESLKHSIFEEKVLEMLLSRAIIEKGE
ncbi:MAG: trigger factor [Nitrospirota bacterium]